MGILHIQCYYDNGVVFENAVLDKNEIKLIYAREYSLEIHLSDKQNLSYIAHKYMSSRINDIIIDIMKHKDIDSLIQLYYTEKQSKNKVNYIVYSGNIKEQIIM